MPSALTDTSSEQYRHECEARAIIRLPTLEARRARLAAIEEERGKPARERLEQTIKQLWGHRDRPEVPNS